MLGDTGYRIYGFRLTGFRRTGYRLAGYRLAGYRLTGIRLNGVRHVRSCRAYIRRGSNLRRTNQLSSSEDSGASSCSQLMRGRTRSEIFFITISVFANLLYGWGLNCAIVRKSVLQATYN